MSSSPVPLILNSSFSLPLSPAFCIYYAEKLSWMLSPSQKLHTYTQEEVPSQKVVESCRWGITFFTHYAMERRMTYPLEKMKRGWNRREDPEENGNIMCGKYNGEWRRQDKKRRLCPQASRLRRDWMTGRVHRARQAEKLTSLALLGCTTHHTWLASLVATACLSSVAQLTLKHARTHWAARWRCK